MNSQRLITAIAMLPLLSACSLLNVELPNGPGEKKIQWANQGWANADRHWFHHAEQGTNTFGMPAEWFKALEQPTLSLSTVGLFSDQDYLARFGFIKSPISVDRDGSARNDATNYGYTTAAVQSKFSGTIWNSENLPVGFAVGGPWYDPVNNRFLPVPGTDRKTRSLGLTCAACHTGQLEYNGYRILVDGGPAMISLDKFREALALSLGFTKIVPGRFERFAVRILGDANNDVNRGQLKQQFDVFTALALKEKNLEDAMAAQPGALDEGFARLDALNRIGNEVFAGQMNLPENMQPITGPVSFPYIWNASWFDWVQYNSSIEQPMVRNLGEAMGVKGKVNLTDPKSPFDAYIPVENLHAIEQLLAGDVRPLDARKFGGLQSPKWSDFAALGILPPLDKELIAQGRRLYMGDKAKDQRGLCVGCHLPPLDSPDLYRDEYWRSPTTSTDKDYLQSVSKVKSVERKFLALVTVPALEIGTDCRTAYGMAYRTVTTPGFIRNSGTVFPPFKAGEIPKDCPQPVTSGASANPKEGFIVTNFGVALGEVVGNVKQRWYATNGKSVEEQLTMDGDRPNGIRAMVPNAYYPNHCADRAAPNASAGASGNCPNPQLPSYRARPLNGVWATAPFLHNGSIPNLYLLLGSQDERDAQAAKFYVGSLAYDPKNVGYLYRTDKGGNPQCPNLSDVSVLQSSKGLFELDTAKPGNRNTGHLFSDDKSRSDAGRIGRALSCGERFAIIEFLKSL